MWFFLKGPASGLSSTCYLQRALSRMPPARVALQSGRKPEGGTCDESKWPDLDHNLVCGECKVRRMNGRTNEVD